MPSMPDTKLHLDLGKFNEALRALGDIPVELKGAVKIDDLIEYMDKLFSSNVFPEEEDIDPGSIQPPSGDVLVKLREKGIEIAEDGYIENFPIGNNTRVLMFFARLVRGMYHLNKYIAVIGLDNIKNGIYDRSEKLVGSSTNRDAIKFGILYLEYFFKLMEFTYTNLVFTNDRGEVILTGRAIGEISGNIFRGMTSVLGKWYGGNMTGFSEYIRAALGATFSAWLVLKQRYPKQFDIRPASEEEDKMGIDFVISQNGKIIKYVQCKARKEEDGKSSAYVSFEGKSRSESKNALAEFERYIEFGASYESNRVTSMKTSLNRLIDECERKSKEQNGTVEWEWLFVPPNYYINS